MKKTVLTMLCAALIITPLAGCSQGKASSDSPSAPQTQEVDSPKSAAIPEGGWTDKSLLDVTTINGIKLSQSYTLSDIGDGFGLATGAGYFLKGDNRNTATLTYNGKNCGYATVEGDADENTIWQKRVVTISFSRAAEGDPDAPDKFPFSMNGVTVGSSYDDVVSKLGFRSDKADFDPAKSDATFSVTGLTDTYYVRMMGSKGVVNSITFGDRTEIAQ